MASPNLQIPLMTESDGQILIRSPTLDRPEAEFSGGRSFYKAKIEGRDKVILRAGIDACRPVAFAQIVPKRTRLRRLIRKILVGPLARPA